LGWGCGLARGMGIVGGRGCRGQAGGGMSGGREGSDVVH